MAPTLIRKTTVTEEFTREPEANAEDLAEDIDGSDEPANEVDRDEVDPKVDRCKPT